MYWPMYEVVDDLSANMHKVDAKLLFNRSYTVQVLRHRTTKELLVYLRLSENGSYRP